MEITTVQATPPPKIKTAKATKKQTALLDLRGCALITLVISSFIKVPIISYSLISAPTISPHNLLILPCKCIRSIFMSFA